MHKENDFRRSDFLNAPVLQQPRGEEWSKSINHMVIKQRLKTLTDILQLPSCMSECQIHFPRQLNLSFNTSTPSKTLGQTLKSCWPNYCVLLPFWKMTWMEPVSSVEPQERPVCRHSWGKKPGDMMPHCTRRKRFPVKPKSGSVGMTCLPGGVTLTSFANCKEKHCWHV